MLNKEIYERAMFAQSAPNLSAIANALARDLKEIWEEARELGEGTDYVNQHPVVRLYLEQMVFLNKAGFIEDEAGTYSKAYNLIADKIKELS